MAITMYTGFVGSGKSYAATALGCNVADARLGSRWVVANFPIKPKKLMTLPALKKQFPFVYLKKRFNDPRWIFKENEELTVKFLVQESIARGWKGNEGSALLIFDEASIPFNSREWQNKKNGESRMDWIKFLSQSRKFGYDIIFITQDGRMLDRQIRSLCEFERTHRKLNSYGLFQVLPRFLTIFAGIQYWNGMKYTKGSLHLTVYNSSVADRYDTTALFDYEAPEDDLEAKYEA